MNGRLQTERAAAFLRITWPTSPEYAYILIELAEAISNTLHHILAREKGIPVSGYIDTIVKGKKEEIISAEIFQKLKPFFDFRNSLIHRYWIIDEEKLIENIKSGKDDFDQFVDEVEVYLRKFC